ncbi:MAG: TIGR03960 family B12-binding radical SAM protein [Candidatus Sulfobium sp.]
MNFSLFHRPSRYINGELNSTRRKAPLRVALAFPDVYEIGMSHLGLKILYSIINAIPYASAERVFSPWTDLEDYLRKSGTLLASLESRTPLKEFDIVGFSLQYELCYTTVLNMLHLGGIPLRSEERLDGKPGPLVIAGGPCTLNPHPMAAFIDAFLVGDGEDAVKELIAVYQEWKKEGTGSRISLLESLRKIEGIFVPALGKDHEVRRRIIPSLEDAPFPVAPVVPFTGIVHDRINIEIARGCSMGCRFCQAGMAYRPVRERSPGKILELAEASLKHTGYEDISFTSLSSGDYSCLSLLLQKFNRRFSGSRVAISLPSLRVASINSDVLKEIRSVRKTGFTIAPEAGTERLRAVINKDFREDTYLRALETLFREGWHNLKLYFMTGLPTETEEDISAIPEMVLQAIRISKRLRGRHLNLSVGVSPFIPKPHTPFQWFGQNDIAGLKEKDDYLKRAFLRRGVKYKGHNEEMSLLEAALARGNAGLSGLIEEAWASGCRLDAWTELFDFDKWKRAMEKTGIDARDFAVREYGPDSRLPWDNVSTGVEKAYLRKEYRKALSAAFTKDCKRQCHSCGLKCGPGSPAAESETAAAKSPALSAGTAGRALQGVSVKLRMRFAKTGRTRYLSHLELTTALIRAMRRAEFPLKYSSGFHPSPRVSFGPALSVGVGGLKEYLDFEIFPPFDAASALANLNATLPEGLRADRITALYGREKSLNSFIVRYTYEIRSEKGLSLSEKFTGKEEMIVMRKDAPIDLRRMIEETEKMDDRTFRITVRDIGDIKVRLDEVLSGLFDGPPEDLEVTRTAMFGWQGDWVEPLEGEKVWTAKS